MIPVFKPCYGEEEIEALREPFKSGWTGLGPKTKEFEDRFAEFIGVNYAIGVNSATAALHLALRIAGVEGKEVITTPMTFISTNHAILYNNGIPVFADIEEDTLNIDPKDVERKVTKNTRVILIVHYGGHACNMEYIMELAERYGLLVIEDCAHACGGMYKDKMLGSIGDYGCFSFHAVKNLSTGDGGMITTNNNRSDTVLRKLRWLGISSGTWDRCDRERYSWEYDVEDIGFKCHMNDITAAIGIVQLGKLNRTNARRRYLAERYTKLLKDVEWLQAPVEKEYTRSAWHNYVIKVNEAADRTRLMDHLKENGISTGMHYIPNHLYKIYRPYVRDPLPVTEEVWNRLITLPLFPDLIDAQQDFIVEQIKIFKR
jgi:perosamine synthetase